MDRSDLPTSIIALLGDAGPGDIDEAVSPVTFQLDRSSPFAGADRSTEVFEPSGSILAESASEGPTFYHRSQKKIKRIGSYNSRLEFQWGCDRDRSCSPPTGSSGNHHYMQSTLGWIAPHAGAGGWALNLLFADGSVRTFTDQNGDQYLNPGYPIPDGLDEKEYDRLGYRDSLVELSPAEFFSGVFLAPETLRGNFDL